MQIRRQISFNPTKNLKMLKKLFNIISPNIVYDKLIMVILFWANTYKYIEKVEIMLDKLSHLIYNH